MKPQRLEWIEFLWWANVNFKRFLCSGNFPADNNFSVLGAINRCPSPGSVQLLVKSSYLGVYFLEKKHQNFTQLIHFKDETNVPWSNRSRSVNHQPVCSYSDIFRKFSAPLALAFVLLQDLHVPKTSVRHGNLLPKSSKQQFKNSTSLRTLQRIGKNLIASNLLIEAYSNQWDIMKQNGMICDRSKNHERCQPECSFLSKSWTTVFLQHLTVSHDSVVWNLTFVFAQARSGIWNKKASGSMSRSDLVS